MPYRVFLIISFWSFSMHLHFHQILLDFLPFVRVMAIQTLELIGLPLLSFSSSNFENLSSTFLPPPFVLRA
jgi:hypothetical protein